MKRSDVYITNGQRLVELFKSVLPGASGNAELCFSPLHDPGGTAQGERLAVEP
jgi:hypothetical protein